MKNIYKRIAIKAVFVFTAFGWYSCKSTYQPALSNTRSIEVNQEIKEDSAIQAIIKPYALTLTDSMETVIGYSTNELTKNKVESTLGNFIADLLKTQSQKYSSTPVDMGGVTTGGLRIALPQGPIKIGDIFELMPFENEVVLLTLKGETVKELLDFMAQKKTLSLSNTEVIIKEDQVLEAKINGKPFDINKTYTLAISDYLAGGGDDMFFLKNALKKEILNIKVREVIVNQIKDLSAKGQKISAKVEGRVQVKN